MPQKLNSFLYPIDKIFQTTIPSTSMTHTCPPLLRWTSLGYSLLKLLTGSLISLLLLNQLHQFFSPCLLLTLYRTLSSPVWSTHLTYGAAPRTLNKVESKAFRLIDSPLLTDCLQPPTLHRNVASLAIFYRYFHANCSSELVSLTAHDFLLTFIPILSTSLIKELISIFTLSFLLLVNSGTLCLNLYFHLPTTWTRLREEYQHTCNTNLALLFLFYFL